MQRRCRKMPRPRIIPQRLTCKSQPRGLLTAGSFDEITQLLQTLPSAMSFAHKTLTAAAVHLTKRSTPRVLSRSFADRPYPFTKPAANAPSPTPRDPPTSQYPFTNASALTRVAAPSHPVENPGPNPDPSPVISKDAIDVGHVRGHSPDYTVAENYTTSYVPSWGNGLWNLYRNNGSANGGEKSTGVSPRCQSA